MWHTRWRLERLRKHQDKHVRAVIRYAFEHVPFYHERFRRLDLRPEDFRSVADLKKIPVIRRNELQANSDKLVSDEFDASKLKVVSTSGSTGRPFFTHLSDREVEFRRAKLLRPHLVCGQKSWDKWVVIGPPQHHSKVSEVQRLLRVYSPLFVSVFDGVPEQLRAINGIVPDVLDGYSGSLVLLAQEVRRSGNVGVQPKFCMGGAELIDQTSRDLIEGAFDAPYYDQFASEEFQMLAWQCPAKGGYHVDADTVVMQFLDENGEEVTAGEKGEIVCTSLFNFAMPFVRYALGDVGVPSDADPCRCGVGFPLMKLLEGRSEEAIMLPDGRRLSPLAVGDCMCAFKHFESVLQYRFVQRRADLFRILIHKKPGGIGETIMGRELACHVRETLRLGEAEVEVEFVSEIPPDKSGKIRKVVSELGR